MSALGWIEVDIHDGSLYEESKTLKAAGNANLTVVLLLQKTTKLTPRLTEQIDPRRK